MRTSIWICNSHPLDSYKRKKMIYEREHEKDQNSKHNHTEKIIYNAIQYNNVFRLKELQDIVLVKIILRLNSYFHTSRNSTK